MRWTKSGALGCWCLSGLVATLTYWVYAQPVLQLPSPAVGLVMRGLGVFFALCVPVLAFAGIARLPSVRHRGTRDRLAIWLDRLAALPSWGLTLPAALCASWVTTRISLTPGPSPYYWWGFALWLGAILGLLASFASRRTWQDMRLRLFAPRWWNPVESEAGLIILLALIAFVLRVVLLGSAPLFHGDEETLGEESLRALHGIIKNMFSAGWEGVPSLTFFIVAGSFRLFGVSIFSVRMVSAIVGTGAVVVTYLALREMFGRNQALIGALFLAGFDYHLHFSRTGLVNVGDTLLAPATLLFVYRATRDERPVDFAALGLLCGLTLYVYTTTRVIPVVVVTYVLLLCVFQRGFLRRNIGRFALAVCAGCVAAMPIGMFFLLRPDMFGGRITSVGLFQSGWLARQHEIGRDLSAIFWNQVRQAFGAFVYYPALSNVGLYAPPQPLVRGLAAIPFLVGVVYALAHVRKRQYALLLVALVVPTLLGGALTLPPTSWQRLLSTIPPITGFVAVGVWQLACLLFFWRHSFVPAVAIAATTGLLVQDVYLYFKAAVHDSTFGPPVRWVTVQYVKALPRHTRIYWYGAPSVYGHFAATSLHDRLLIDVFDAAPHALLPVSHPSPSAYLFMPFREDELAGLQEECPGGVTKTLMHDGKKVLTVYELTTNNTCLPKLEPPPPNDKFSNAVVITALPFTQTISTKAATLDDHEPQPGPPRPGDPLPCGGINDTAWYAFVSDTDVRLTARTVGSSTSTLVAVYEGTDLTALTPIACSRHGAEPRAAALDFTARAGVPYRFQIAAQTYAVGTVTFSLEPTPAQPQAGEEAPDVTH
jgi:4-amino-4-deoxy-L-arabinose transferase-like glycosyltransferase